MAFDTYVTLGPALQRYTGRSDIVSSGFFDDAVLQFEAWVNRNIRHRSMLLTITTPTLVLTGGKLQHPTDWLEWESLRNATSPRNVEIVTAHYLADLEEKILTGTPRYAIPGANDTELYPVPTSVSGMKATYYQKVPTLSLGANWISQRYPDLYLNGCLLALNAWVRDSEETMKYGAAFDKIVEELKMDAVSTRFGGSTLTIRSSR